MKAECETGNHENASYIIKTNGSHIVGTLSPASDTDSLISRSTIFHNSEAPMHECHTYNISVMRLEVLKVYLNINFLWP